MGEKKSVETLDKLTTPHKITLYQRLGSPHIYYRFTYKGKLFKSTTKTSQLEEARKIAFHAFHEAKTGKPKSKKLQFSRVAKKFMKHKSPHVKPGTLTDYEYRISVLGEFFKDKDITSFTREDFTKYIEWRKKPRKTKGKTKGKTKERTKERNKLRIHRAGMNTFNRDLALLKSILNFAKDEYSLAVTIPKWKLFPEKIRTDLLSVEELEKLRQYWLGKNPYYWDVFSFILNTGLRYPSEINELRWKNVDFENKLLRIKRKTRLVHKDKFWIVPLINDEAMEILYRLRKRDVPKGPDDFVFVDNQGKRIMNLGKAHKLALELCGIEKDFPVFSFRHQFATEMTARGYPPKMIADAMGHTSLQMVDRIYTNLTHEHYVLIQERIGKKETDKKETDFDKWAKDLWSIKFEPLSPLTLPSLPDKK